MVYKTSVRKIKTNTIKYCEAKAKTSKRLKEKASTSIQSSPQLGPCHFYVSEDSELTDTDDETHGIPLFLILFHFF
jgi:hypothetical protein